jgi:hypothetical protein
MCSWYEEMEMGGEKASCSIDGDEESTGGVECGLRWWWPRWVK